jgi:hypothetical protein
MIASEESEMRIIYTVMFLLCVACSSKPAKPALDETDPCNEVGLKALGEEVAIKKLELPQGCVPSLISEYEPNGKFGQKIFTRRSNEKLLETYICGETTPQTSGIDFEKEGVAVMLWERPESKRKKVTGIRDNGKLITIVQEFSRCSTGDPTQFTVEHDAFIVPVKDKKVAVHNCEVKVDSCK